MTLPDLVVAFGTHTLAQVNAMSTAQLRQAMVNILVKFSNENAGDFSPQHTTTEALIGKGAVLFFLKNSGLLSEATLKSSSTDNHQNSLISLNHQYTNLPTWRLQLLADQQLVHLALTWYTKIEMTPFGVLKEFDSYTTSQLKNMSADVLRNAMVQELARFSNEQTGTFQAIADDNILVGKLAVVVFLRRAQLKTDAELKDMSSDQQRTVLEQENHYRTGIPSQFLAKSIPAGWKYQLVEPMSAQKLVEMGLAWFVVDKPYAKYNDITSAMAHDSHTGDADSFFDRPFKDQYRTIQEQLRSGIRTARISSTGDAELKHSMAGFGTLENYLTAVVNFLKNDATEDVFTIIDESKWSDKVKNVYTETLKDLLLEPGKDGMPDLSDLQAGKWPTLKQMVQQGKRVVVFVNQPYDPQVPWRLPAYDSDSFMISMDKDDYGWAPILNNIRPHFTEVKNQSVDKNTGKKTRYKSGNPLYLLNHYIYLQVGFNTSLQYFSKWGIGELLIEYSKLAWALTKQRPNFLNVDFYDSEPTPNGNFLFNCVIAMNWPDVLGPYHMVNKIDKPINLTDTDDLQIGKVYTISCVAKGSDETTYNVTRSADNVAVSLQKANASDPQQHWKLIYNTPSVGIALVDPEEQVALYDPGADDPNRNLRNKHMECLPYTVGEKSTAFAFRNIGDNKWRIYTDRFYDLPEANQSFVEVSGKDKDIVAGDPIGRWEDNGGDNQKWVFTQVNLPVFVPPAIPEPQKVQQIPEPQFVQRITVTNSPDPYFDQVYDLTSQIVNGKPVYKAMNNNHPIYIFCWSLGNADKGEAPSWIIQPDQITLEQWNAFTHGRGEEPWNANWKSGVTVTIVPSTPEPPQKVTPIPEPQGVQRLKVTNAPDPHYNYNLIYELTSQRVNGQPVYKAMNNNRPIYLFCWKPGNADKGIATLWAIQPDDITPEIDNFYVGGAGEEPWSASWGNGITVKIAP
jgi:hypothetical protein